GLDARPRASDGRQAVFARALQGPQTSLLLFDQQVLGQRHRLLPLGALGLLLLLLFGFLLAALRLGLLTRLFSLLCCFRLFCGLCLLSGFRLPCCWSLCR